MNKSNISMKKSPTLILKAVGVLIGLGVLALCIFALPSIWTGVVDEYRLFPSVIYSIRLFVVGMYLSIIPFFIGLYQGLKLLGFIDNNLAFSDLSVRSLRNIKYCASIIGVIYLCGVPLLLPFANIDDAPGVLLFGFAFACVPIIVSIFASVLQKLIQNALDIKHENDLTV